MRQNRASVVRFLCGAERQIALLSRAQPRNVGKLRATLTSDWANGLETVPQLVFDRCPPLGAVRRGLELVWRFADQLGRDSGFIADRSEELATEAMLAESIGAPGVPSLAACRFKVPAPSASTLETLARRWLGEARSMDGSLPSSETLVVRSDDESDPKSVICTVRRYVGAARLPVRVEVRPELLSLAAAREDWIGVAAGRWVRPIDASRVALHEIEAHVRPRLAARSVPDSVLTCGCAGAGEDEEGRALWIEQRHGLLDQTRRGELGCRHLAGVLVRGGAHFVEAMHSLLEAGAKADQAVSALLRALRGGGLAREVVYLPAMVRIGGALSTSPTLEHWFCRGRASLQYALARQAQDAHAAFERPSRGLEPAVYS